jgi:hypothetical protein
MRDLNSSYFLPHRYKWIGWAIIGLSVLTVAIKGFLYNYNTEFQDLGVVDDIIGSILSYAVMIGLTILVSSREKQEDEMIRLIRLKSFQYGFYLTVFLSLLFFLISIADRGFNAYSFITDTMKIDMFFGINATLAFIVAIYHFKLFRLRNDEE